MSSVKYQSLIQTPSGILCASFCEEGRLISLEIQSNNSALGASRQKHPSVEDRSVLRRMAQLRATLGCPLKSRYLGVFLDDLARLGTSFQRRVWRTLIQIPYGETRSYSQIADKLNCPKSVRAVANAIGANPFHVLVPCHRVLRKCGALGGFAAGVSIKQHLLLEEGVKL